jgi:hypothetical protein
MTSPCGNRSPITGKCTVGCEPQACRYQHGDSARRELAELIGRVERVADDTFEIWEQISAFAQLSGWISLRRFSDNAREMWSAFHTKGKDERNRLIAVALSLLPAGWEMGIGSRPSLGAATVHHEAWVARVPRAVEDTGIEISSRPSQANALLLAILTARLAAMEDAAGRATEMTAAA